MMITVFKVDIFGFLTFNFFIIFNNTHFSTLILYTIYIYKIPRAVGDISVRTYDNFTVFRHHIMHSGASDVKEKRIRKPNELLCVAR